jgi:uncharacterized protein (DUF1499 family)
MTFVYLILALVVAFAAYVRIAPTDVAKFHSLTAFEADADDVNGVKRVLSGDATTMAKLDEIIRATPRTQVLAGSAESGFVTYVTRSVGFGFPDYATVILEGDTIKIHSRLRFGRSDLGVNRKRVKAWIDALGAM